MSESPIEPDGVLAMSLDAAFDRFLEHDPEFWDPIGRATLGEWARDMAYVGLTQRVPGESMSAHVDLPGDVLEFDPEYDSRIEVHFDPKVPEYRVQAPGSAPRVIPGNTPEAGDQAVEAVLELVRLAIAKARMHWKRVRLEASA